MNESRLNAHSMLMVVCLLSHLCIVWVLLEPLLGDPQLRVGALKGLTALVTKAGSAVSREAMRSMGLRTMDTGLGNWRWLTEASQLSATIPTLPAPWFLLYKTGSRYIRIPSTVEGLQPMLYIIKTSYISKNASMVRESGRGHKGSVPQITSINLIHLIS